MTNASKFLKEFGCYATEVWAMPEKDFLAWLNAEAIEPEQPKNVFVFRSNTFFKHDDIEVIRNIIKRQIKEGVVVLSSYVTLKAVTGPCTDVEVIIKQEGQP